MYQEQVSKLTSYSNEHYTGILHEIQDMLVICAISENIYHTQWLLFSSADFHHKKSLEPDNSLRSSRYLFVSHQHWEHHFWTSKALRSKVANIPLWMFESKWGNFSFYFWVPRPTHVPFPLETQHSRGISNLIMRDWIKTHNDKILYEIILTILRSQTTALVVIQLKK